VAEVIAPLVLVTGGSGFLGLALSRTLKAAGWRVRTTVRDGQSSPDRFATGDLRGDTDWSAALQGVDVVVHAAGRAHKMEKADDQSAAAFKRVNVDATLALARQAAASGVRRLVFISSIGVNGSSTHGRGFRHDDPPHPHSPYAHSKWEAEQGLRGAAAETGLEVVIIRPPLILGPEPKGNLATLNKVIARGLPLPFGLVRANRRDLVSLDILCDLIETALDHPAAAGQTFLASDGAPISTRTLLQKLAADQGRSVRLAPVPPSWLGAFLKLAGKSALAAQLLGDLEVDIQHTRNTLGWSPPSEEKAA
jgi:nucleoside-diphosphate-sugar epimerase